MADKGSLSCTAHHQVTLVGGVVKLGLYQNKSTDNKKITLAISLNIRINQLTASRTWIRRH